MSLHECFAGECYGPQEPRASGRRPFIVIWIYLSIALSILIAAIALALIFGFIRYTREVRDDEGMDDYF